MGYLEAFNAALGTYQRWRTGSDQAKTQASVAQQQMQAQMAMQAQAEASQRTLLMMAGGFAVVLILLTR